MRMQNKIPHFTYHLLNRNDVYYRHIETNLVAIHCIENTFDFYKALGYTEELIKAELKQEGFSWTDYHSDNAVKANFCLQPKIIEYLNKHSEKFREKYGNQYASWAGSCTSDKISDSEYCTSCWLHPHNNKK